MMSPALWTADSVTNPNNVRLGCRQYGFVRLDVNANQSLSSSATGVAVPILTNRYKDIFDFRSFACSAAYFRATAPRGALPTTPNRRYKSRSLIFTTRTIGVKRQLLSLSFPDTGKLHQLIDAFGTGASLLARKPSRE